MRKLTELENQTIEAAKKYIETLKGSSLAEQYIKTTRDMIEYIKAGEVSDDDLKHLLNNVYNF